MKRGTTGWIALAGALALTGCGGGSNSASSGGDDGGGGTTPPPPSMVSFTQFVTDQIAQTSDTSQPADVNGMTFSFPDDENSGAFDGVLGGP